jgi:predicted nucleic acid-binding protein
MRWPLNKQQDRCRRDGKRGQGRELRDAMIAGIGIARRTTLATRNLRHFDGLPVPGDQSLDGARAGA